MSCAGAGAEVWVGPPIAASPSPVQFPQAGLSLDKVLELQEGVEGRKILLLLDNDHSLHATKACARVKTAVIIKMFNFP